MTRGRLTGPLTPDVRHENQKEESMMKKIGVLVSFAVLVCMYCARSSAQTRPVITSFHGNGELIWTNSPSTNAFAIQWASSMNGEWHEDWSRLRTIVSTSAQNTAYVPMFYRVVQGFANFTLEGPWIISILSETNHHYIVFDGTGVCTEWGAFNTYGPPGMYTCSSTGDVVLVLFEKDNPDGLSLTGRFSTGDEIVFEPPMDDILLTRVNDPALCQGSWTGTLYETSGPLYPVSFDVTKTGWIENFTGFPSRVRGRMFGSASGNLSCFFRTGADPEMDPYNQVQITGTISNDIVNATYTVDDSEGTGGAAIFYRQ